jgi:Ca2+-binding RTX toxin-like protein
VNEGQVQLRFDEFDPDNVLANPAPLDSIRFADGVEINYEQLLSQGFDIDGTDGDDTLDGTNITDRINGLDGDDVINSGQGDDVLEGGSGNDVLAAGSGNDLLIGGTGNDQLQGGVGDDTYLFNLGDGQDVISDSVGFDQLVFGVGLSTENINVEHLGDDLVIELNDNDKVTIENWFANPENKIERIVFTDDNLRIIDTEEIEAFTNRAPVVSAGIADQITDEDAAFSFALPTDAFSDPDTGDSLSYSATLVGGAALPAWLLFDTATQTFSGTPDNNDVGAFNVEVTATDTGGLSVSDEFNVVINNVNDAPELQGLGVGDLEIDEDQPFTFSVPTNTFRDDDAIHGDSLTYSASLSDDSVLPSWLSFDAATQTFSGTPDNNDVGALNVEVTATDTGGLSVSDEFNVVINNVNDSPIVSNAISDQSTDEDQVFSFTVPADTFADDDAIHGDTFSYSIGSTLPSWLSFDAATQTFSGTPDNNDVGAFNVEVTATDTGGLSISDEFTVTINNINDAPIVSNAISDQSTDEDQAFSFTVPADTFADDDLIHGDSLSFSASLADDSALPSWLSFNAATQTFSGTPDNNDVDVIDVKVTATDTGGLSVSDEFTVTINNTNDVPVLINPLSDQSIAEGQAFNLSIPTDTFFDDDLIHGDSFSFSANLADGGALPSWINIDPVSGTLSGNAPFDAAGDLSIEVTATDSAGISINDTFNLEIINTINGTSGNDELEGTPDKDIINGLGGNDEIEGKGDDDQLFGGAGNDEIEGGDGDDFLDGGSGNDELEGDKGNDQLFGGAGNDELEGDDGDDFLDGGSGNDELEGDKGNDQLFGGAGNDELEGGDGDDYLDGGSGNDELEGDKGNDQLFGGSGNDELDGGKGDDFLDGGSGNDELEGEKGNDQLFGGSGNDELDGGKGDDFLDGGSGNDELEGEKGDDTYQFNRGYDMDRITDDKSGDDRVLFADINHNELWFWREGDDLQIGILDTLDRLTIEDWYDGDNRIETFNTTDDNYALSETNVQQLVDAMASFSVPNSGSLDVPQDIQDDIQSVITTAWQTA